MTRALRGAWSRRGALSTLAAMTAVVVAGAAATLRFADAADTPSALAAPLLLLGAVAVPTIGAELSVARRDEVGLARLRGIRGVRLWALLLVEPLLAIGLGLLAGIAVGAAVAVLTTRRWLGEAADPLDATALLVSVAIAGSGLVIVALGAASGLREPLSTQVSTRHRPRRATTLTLFFTVLVAVGAGVAAYRSRQDGAEPDLLVLLGPALVGLAMGQVAIGLVRLLARIGTELSSSRGLAVFLTTRRLARADDLVTPIRLVVAASVVGTLALTGAGAVDRWSDDEARIESVGPRIIDTDLGATGAWQLTRRLDPAGRHLMATALVPSENRLGERRGFVDAARWDAVVGDFLDDTPAGAASAAVPALVDATPPAFSAGRFTVAVTALVKAPTSRVTLPGAGSFRNGSNGVEVGLDYVTTDGSAGSVAVELDLARSGDRARRSVRIRGSEEGCTVTRLAVSRVLASSRTFVAYDDTEMEVRLDTLEAGDADLLDQAWLPDAGVVEASDENPRGDDAEPRRLLVNTPAGLVVSPPTDMALPLLLEAASAPLPVLATDREADAASEESPDAPSEQALDPAGDERPAAVRGVSDALPLVGTAGVLADLPSAAVGSGPSVPSSLVRVVAAADAPQDLRDRVEAEVGATWRPVAVVRSDLADAHGGQQAVGYLLTAIACALVALLALAAGVARHRRDYRRDMAALRVLGVGLATARRAGRTELAALGVLVAVTVAIGGWLAVVLLLGGLPLLELPVASLPLDTSPSVLGLLLPALLATAAVLAVGGRARRVAGDTTRPSTLREEEGR